MCARNPFKESVHTWAKLTEKTYLIFFMLKNVEDYLLRQFHNCIYLVHARMKRHVYVILLIRSFSIYLLLCDLNVIGMYEIFF